MNAHYSSSPLYEIVTPVERPISPLPGQIYRQLGVQLWGRGAYERETLEGSQTKYKTLSRVETGDIVVNKIWARNGSVAVVPSEISGCYVSGEFPTFVPLPDKLEPAWFHWYTKTPVLWQQCDEKSRGTSGKNRIRPEKFLEIEIPLPPLDEQRRIVARIENLARRIQTAQKLRQQCSNDSDRLLISMAHRRDLSTAEKHRQGWRDVTLGDLLRQVEDIHRVMPEGTYPNLGIYSFGRGLFKKQPIQGLSTRADKLYRVRSGQFIYSRLFAFEGAYGWVDEKFDGYYVSGEYPVFDCDQNRVRPDFRHAHFKSPAVWEAVAAGSKGLGHRRQRVKADHLLRYEMQLPPMEWQDRIGRTMKHLELLNHTYSASAAELDALMPSILSKAFRGEL